MPSYAAIKRTGLSNYLTPAILFIVCASSRLPFTSRLLYNIDSVQFALGMDRFDVALHQPQPPGYFLYVLMGRTANLLTGDENTALISLSVLFSGLAVVMLYTLAKELFGGSTGIAAAVIGITSPLIWFHGEVALSYMPEGFMSLTVAWLCLKVIKGDHRFIAPAALALGIAGGIRQNTMVFLMPLWLYSLYGLGIRRALVAAVVFLGTVAAWTLPMLAATGGYARYSAALDAHWLDSNWRGIHLSWIAFNARFMTYFILSGLVLAAVPLIDYAIGALAGRTRLAPERSTALFFIIWLLPSFLFHLIIFTHPAVPGHSLIYVVGLVILAARAIDYTAGRISKASPGLSPGKVRAALVVIIAAANTAFFLLAPYPLSARGIADHDRVLSGYITAVRCGFSPQDTEIIGMDRFLYGYRHAMYYLPEFRVYDTVLLTTPDGPRLFWGMGRKTHRSRYIEPGPNTKRFVDFVNYDESSEGALPPHAHITRIGGGYILVHYEGIEVLYGVDRVAPLLTPKSSR